MAKLFWRMFFILSLIVTITSFISILSLYFYFSRYAQSPEQVSNIVIEIPYGSSAKRVSEILYTQGLIKDQNLFYWFLRLYREDTARMQAGYYVFEGEVSANDIAERLQTGRDQSYKIVYKEGENLLDLALALEKIDLVSIADFEQAMQSPEIADLIPITKILTRRKIKNDVGGIEGYLFPDTYFFSKRDTGVTIIKKMHQRLLDKIAGNIKNSLEQQNKTLHEVLTLASIVEKETGAVSERPMIASVYQNRLKINMRLQADPTVIYGIKDYNGKIRKADLLNYHAYNTYKITGLPPGPIAAAGLESIKAVLWPELNNYLYFVSKNDGTHWFCKDLDCHNQAVRKYQIDYFRAKNKAEAQGSLKLH
jgi:UPF0755 protein